MNSRIFSGIIILFMYLLLLSTIIMYNVRLDKQKQETERYRNNYSEALMKYKEIEFKYEHLFGVYEECKIAE